MNFKLLNIIGIKELINRVGSTIDTVVQNKTEREKLRNDIFAIIYQLDIKSDSWLSKNVRPITLVICWVTFVFFAVSDGNWLTIKEIYREMLVKWMGVITTFYFGLRELGKYLGK